MENIDKIINDAIEKAAQVRGKFNVLIAGRSGAGKSTLINSIFQGNLAETGQGRPVTQNTKEISKEGVPITIWDTRGLEMAEYKKTISDLESTLKNLCNEKDANKHIHVAWVCIQEDGRRVESAEIELHKMLARYVPVISVITKSRADNDFSKVVMDLLPEAKSCVRVRALCESLDDGHLLKPMGLGNLIYATSEVIPEGKRIALAAAQKANIEFKKEQARKIVAAASTAAAAAGASPIPFSDALILAPIQVGMIAGITSVFGIELSKGTLTTLVASALGVGGATFVGRTIVTNLIKFIPGVGTVAGGVISGATASALTAGLGEAYIKTLERIFTSDPDAKPSGDFLAEELKGEMKSS